MNRETVVLQLSNLNQGGTAHKEYRLTLVELAGGWFCNFEYGRIGSALRPGTKTPTPVSKEEARRLFNKYLSEKTSEGYRIISNTAVALPPARVEQAHQIITQAAPECANEYRPCELLSEIDEAEAMRLIKDPTFLLQKKMNGQRRRVLKQNGKIFGLNKINKVIPVTGPILEDLERLPLDTFRHRRRGHRRLSGLL